MEPERLLTINEMAKLMGANRNLVGELVKKGFIPVLRFGRIRKARVSAFNRFLEAMEGRDIYEAVNMGKDSI